MKTLSGYVGLVAKWPGLLIPRITEVGYGERATLRAAGSVLVWAKATRVLNVGEVELAWTHVS